MPAKRLWERLLLDADAHSPKKPTLHDGESRRVFRKAKRTNTKGNPLQPNQAASTYVAYYRVSTARQGESGLGLEAQRDAVHRMAGDVPIIAEYQEVESGKRHTNRPQLLAAINHAKRTKATLLIAKLDRLARNVHFISGLLESGVDFMACDLPTANRFTIHIMSAMAEHERELISARTKAGLAVIKKELAQNGFRVSRKSGRKFKKLGNPNWGPALAKANASRKFNRTPERIQAMLQRFRSEGKSFQKIADEMNALGLTAPSGAKWYPGTVRVELMRVKEAEPTAA